MGWRDYFGIENPETIRNIRKTLGETPDDTNIADIADTFLGVRSDDALEAMMLATLEAMMLATFPGAQSLGIHPSGTFQGPMVELSDLRRCPVCHGTKHWWVVDGKEICVLCNSTATGTTSLASVVAVEGDDFVVYPTQPDFFREEEK